MPPEDSLYPAEWQAIAEKDFMRVQRGLRDDDPELAAFYLQQSVEKYLKAYLLANGWRLRRTHNLTQLPEEAIVLDATLEPYRTVCETISAFYIATRYATASTISEEEVRQAFADVTPLIERMRSAA